MWEELQQDSISFEYGNVGVLALLKILKLCSRRFIRIQVELESMGSCFTTIPDGNSKIMTGAL
jgi:hypothetical protein